MKIIKISDSRRLNLSSIVVGYSQENKIEKIAFEIPDEYKEFGRKACFEGNGTKFAKTFDNVTGDTLTLTRDMTQFKKLKMSIAFFKVENEDEIVARTSILNITIEDAIVCDDDIKPDDPKIVILDNLITRVTELDNQITQNENFRQTNEKTREENEIIRQQNEAVRKKNEQTWINNELLREKAENDRKNNELKRIANENKRVSDENARQEYINNLKTQVDNGDFDGADFNYKWDGTKLGVKNSKETTYQFVELKGQKGDKGDKGDTGNGIQNIEKVSTLENVDTYAINYTDGTQTTFDVTNGEVTKEQLDEVDSKAKKTRDELERVKNDILETGTASDSFINVQDSAWAELQELSIDGVLKQETTKGLNFWFNATKNQGESNGVTFTLNKDFTYLLNGKNNGNGNSTCFLNSLSSQLFLKAGTYYTIKTPMAGISMTGIYELDGVIKYIQLSSPTIDEFTLNQDVEMRTYLQVYQGVNTTFNNVVLRPMISKQKITDSDYEPYTGGQPSPSPDYPQEIKTVTDSLSVTSCNKNLFSSEWEQGTIDSNTGLNVMSISDIRTKNYIPIISSKTYFFKRNLSTSYQAFRFYDKNKNYLGTQSTINLSASTTDKRMGNGVEQLVFTVNDEKVAFFKAIDNTNDLKTKYTLSVDDFVEYEENIQSQITANLPSGEFIGKIDDTYKDELNIVYDETNGNWHTILKKNIGKKVINSSDNTLIKNTNYSTDDMLVVQVQEDNLDINIKNIKSNYFTFALDTTIGTARGANKFILMGLSAQDYPTVDSYKSWLSTHNVEVYYVLANPYTVDLGVVDMPLSYNEVTNIFTDSDLLPQINAKYYRNFTKTVQNLQVNEKALKQELIDINNRLTALESAKASVIDDTPSDEESEVAE